MAAMPWRMALATLLYMKQMPGLIASHYTQYQHLLMAAELPMTVGWVMIQPKQVSF